MSDDQDLHIALKFLCLFLPLVGLVLFFYYRKEEEVKSKSAGVWALAGVLIGFAINIIF
ncbi:MAG: hypothetical protein RIS47_974 [Bacteroidota bacterium]|jgi:hypothetical protein